MPWIVLGILFVMLVVAFRSRARRSRPLEPQRRYDDVTYVPIVTRHDDATTFATGAADAAGASQFEGGGGDSGGGGASGDWSDGGASDSGGGDSGGGGDGGGGGGGGGD